MMRYKLTILALLCCLTTVMATDIVPGTPQKQPIALVGGDIYTISGEVIQNGTVVFDKGVITAVGHPSSLPENTLVINVQGKNIYPGLIASNTNLGLIEIESVRATIDISEVGDINPNARADIAYNPDSELIPTVRSNGILTALVVPKGSLLAGTSSLVMLDGWTIEDAALKKDVAIHLYWPRMNIVQAWWITKSSEEQQKDIAKNLNAIEEVFVDARKYWKAYQKTQKIDLRWHAMLPVLRNEIPLFIHASEYKQIQAAVYFGQQQNIKVVIVGGADSWKLVPLLQKHKVSIIVDQVHRLPQRSDEDYDLPYRLPKILYEANIPFCISRGESWDVRNLSFHAGTAVGFGLPEDAALKSITLWPAQILGVAQQVGSIEVSKDATLIVSTGDILDAKTHNIELAFIQGKKVNLEDRHKRLYRKYKEKYK